MTLQQLLLTRSEITRVQVILSIGFKSSFVNTNENEVHKVIKNLNAHKTYENSCILTKIKKLNIDLFISSTCQHFNSRISIDEVPSSLKHITVILIYKKRDKCDETNIFQKFMKNNIYNQRYEYFNNKLFLVNLDFIREIVLNTACHL